MLQNASVYGADCIILDLEDAITVTEKDAARILIRNALGSIAYTDTEVTVRVNALSTPFGQEDIMEIVPMKPDAIRLPKCETAEDIEKADQLITEIEQRNGMDVGTTKIIPMIESALGGVNLLNIVQSSHRITAVNYGAEDYTADIGAVRTKEGRELDDIRAKIVVAAKIAGVHALDSVFADIRDDDGLFEEASLARRLGFDGKSVIHPRQIPVVHRAFTPSQKEVSFARRVVRAIEEAEQKKSGVIALNGKMIDAPVVIKARKIIALAEAAGYCDEGALS